MTETHNQQIHYSRFIALQLFLPAIKYYIVFSIPGLEQFNNIANILLGVVFAAYFIKLVPYLIKDNLTIFFLSLFILILIYLWTIIVGRENWENLKDASIDILLVSFTLFVVSRSLTNAEYLFSLMVKYSLVVLALCVLYLFRYTELGITASDGTSYDMSASYFCLLSTSVCFAYIKEKKSIIHIIGFCVGTICILSIGSRGTIVGLLFFVFMYGFKNRTHRIKDYLIFALALLACILLVMNYQVILIKLNDFLVMKGINSRTIRKVIAGKFLTSTSNRDLIAEEILGKITQHPLGIGFMGDLTCHNILLENPLWFGWIVGFILDFTFLYIIFVIIVKVKIDSKMGIVILLIASYAIPDALLNLTIWGKDYFWVMCGLLIAQGYLPRIKKTSRRRYIKLDE